MVFQWVDCDRQYFVMIREYLEKGLAFSRQRWHQVDVDVNSESQILMLDIPKPLEVDIYYTICSSMVRHNQISRNDLKLDRKLGNHSWDHHVILSILGVYVFGKYNVATQYLSYEETYHALLCGFSVYMVDNDPNSIPSRPPSCRTGRSVLPVIFRTRPTTQFFQTYNKWIL